MNKMNIQFSPPDITEEEIAAVTDTLRSGWITTGPKTKLLEERLAATCHTDRAVCLNSATACMELTLRILGIGEGDEVITSAYTYTASASVICHVGAKLVIVDTKADSFEMDYDKLAESITSRTKAVIAVDIGGVLCDYDKIYEIIEKKKTEFLPSSEMQEKLGRIAVIADSAHAFGAVRNGKISGEIADFTNFSFHAVKNLTTAEGGAVVWKDIQGISNDEIYRQYMLLSLHGQSKDALAKSQVGSWEYDIIATYYKCNMTDIMAALGLVQFKRYPTLMARRKEIIEKFDQGLKNLPLKILKHYGDQFASSGHLYLVRVMGKNREQCNDIISKMAADGIATNVHFKPLPLLSAYKDMGFDIKDYPNAYSQFENVITLPLHTKLSDEEVDYIVKRFTKWVEE